jgi:hypothetical protein
MMVPGCGPRFIITCRGPQGVSGDKRALPWIRSQEASGGFVAWRIWSPGVLMSGWPPRLAVVHSEGCVWGAFTRYPASSLS